MGSSRGSCLAVMLALLVGGGARVSGELAHPVKVALTRLPYGRWAAVLDVRHEDQDETHLVDRWEVLDQDGMRIAFRHLHAAKVRDVEEDGDIRRLHGEFPVPPTATGLRFRVHCKRSGWGGSELAVDLAKLEGPGFTVGRKPAWHLPSFEGVEDAFRGRLKVHLARPGKWPYPPRGPVPAVPPDPVDSRPRDRREFR